MSLTHTFIVADPVPEILTEDAPERLKAAFKEAFPDGSIGWGDNVFSTHFKFTLTGVGEKSDEAGAFLSQYFQKFHRPDTGDRNDFGVIDEPKSLEDLGLNPDDYFN